MSLSVAYSMKKRSKGKDDEEDEPRGVAKEGDADTSDGMKYEDDMVGKIMERRYSKGGMVANDVGEASADKEPAEYDDLVLRDDLESEYDEKNSGEDLGNEAEDERRQDMVDKIMRMRAKKDRMPRPA